jgi:hydroxymethylglutaryl-CoA synthase
MKTMKTGISDIQVYLPSAKMDLISLIERRVEEDPRLERHLQRAYRVTGQRAIRFPSVWEDTNTLAASAAIKVFEENKSFKKDKLRYLTVGTESGLDHSKPVAAYVEGMLQKAGIEVPDSLSTFQVQHACAGGTISLLSVSAMLNSAGLEDESGLVICSDVARYESHSTAEITQGAGSVALLVENDAKLLELDIRTQGYSSRDVDDFFRPLGSKVAKVKGTYSMKVYKEALEQAFLDHCQRRAEDPSEVLQNTDLFILHTPFRNMPETSMNMLLEKYMGLSAEESSRYLREKGFYDGIDAVAEVGNLYTGAMYLNLAFALKGQYERYGDDIIGKNVLLASYGSGNTMIVTQATIAERAPEVIAKWNLDSLLNDARNASFEEYQQWVEGPYEPTGLNMEPQRDESIRPRFALESIREDGYREYTHKEKDEAIESNENLIELTRTA